MKKFLPYLRNKFILTIMVFLIYNLFLDEYDIFTLMGEHRKLNQLEKEKAITSERLFETKETLSRLRHLSEAEKFAREKKFFKRDNEDVFVIFHED